MPKYLPVDETHFEKMSGIELVKTFWLIIGFANEQTKAKKPIPRALGHDLRLIIAVLLKRELFTQEQLKNRPTYEIWVFYDFVKQYLEGVSRDEFDPIEAADEQYGNIVHLLQERGEKMPSQRIEAKPVTIGSRAVSRGGI